MTIVAIAACLFGALADLTERWVARRAAREEWRRALATWGRTR